MGHRMSKQWEGSTKHQSQSQQHSQSRDAHGEESPTWQSVGPKGEATQLEWFPSVGSDFLARLSLTDKTAFVLWAELYPYNIKSPEVKALSFLPDFAHMVTRIITRVLWSMVYIIKGGSLPCPDSLVQGLHLVDRVLHQPPESVYPIQINFDKDLWNRARERWEETLSWVQYWWEVGYMAHNLTLFYGGNLRTNSPMVLLVLHHINKVLPERKPIWLEAILANTGWDHARMVLQETNLAEVHHWLEKELLMEEVNNPTHEYLFEHAAEVAMRNYELLQEAVKDPDRHQKRTIQKDAQVRDQRCCKEKQQRQMDLAFQAHN